MHAGDQRRKRQTRHLAPTHGTQRGRRGLRDARRNARMHRDRPKALRVTGRQQGRHAGTG